VIGRGRLAIINFRFVQLIAVVINGRIVIRWITVGELVRQQKINDVVIRKSLKIFLPRQWIENAEWDLGAPAFGLYGQRVIARPRLFEISTSTKRYVRCD
jgi:hypothetical protein